MGWCWAIRFADESGALKFEVLLMEDGQNWREIPAARLPAAKEGEGAFAASNTCLAIVPGGLMRTCGSPRAVKRRECFTPAIADRDGKWSTRRWRMGRIRREFFPLPFATPCMA